MCLFYMWEGADNVMTWEKKLLDDAALSLGKQPKMIL